LTLDDDVQAKLELEVRRTGKSMKETVNGLLRLGLLRNAKPNPSKPFVMPVHDFGGPPRISFDNIGELLETLDTMERANR
jgi:hypothetical protein